MAPNPASRGWRHHFFRRRTGQTTTWRFRLGICAALIAVIVVTRGGWIPALGRGLVCERGTGHGEAILIENFDPMYLLFERAAELRRAGVGPRVIVPAPASSNPSEPNPVSAGIIDVMVGVAQLPGPQVLPIREVEPVSLNAAYEIRAFMLRERIRSVVVVSPGFRSRRTQLVYEKVLGEAGIAISCEPVMGLQGEETWAASWHGMLQVAEQYLKLAYYRLYVLPFATGEMRARSGVARLSVSGN
jgi:hypothetical protein